MEKNSNTRHVNHQGFPLDPDTKISFFHWLMRGRIGMIVFLLLTIILTMFPAIFLSWAVFVCMLSGLVSKDACRRFVNWAFGVWLYMESVSQQDAAALTLFCVCTCMHMIIFDAPIAIMSAL